MKLLSIIIPVYNAEKYLKECIDSIANEINDSIELIIVDDGSTDSSSDIYGKYDNENIKIFKNKNYGVSFSRNYGLKKATGKYVCFVDADDFMTKGWSKIVLDEIKENDNDLILVLKDFPEKILEKNKLLDYTFKIDNTVPWISTPWAKLFKLEHLKEYNIKFKEDVMNGEDMLFNAEVILTADKVSYIDSNIYNYRINPLSVTQTFKSQIFKSDQMFLKYLKELFNDNDFYLERYYNHCLENAIVMFIDKLTLLPKNDRGNYYYIFNEEPYKTFIDEITIYKNKINKMIISSIRNMKFNRAISILVLKKRIRDVLKRRKRDEYILKI